MAKNFADIYTSGNDSSALEQKFFLKKEVTKGTIVAPVGADHFLHTAGNISTSQPYEVSPHKSGRHANNIIEQKEATEWALTTLVNIDKSLGAFAVGEIDQAVRTLFENVLGKETTAPNLIYDASRAPDFSFTLFENGDQQASQAFGAFVQSLTMSFPGDGTSQLEWAGNAKSSYNVGIAKSETDNNTGNVITVQAGEAERFEVGCYVMLVEADGVTRSADTPDGSPRKVTARDLSSHTVTLDGAVLADADGSTDPVYLCYYEPATPAAIDDPTTGLVGSLTLAGLTQDCVRSASVTLANNHTLYDSCFGMKTLGDKLFSADQRLAVTCSVELNLNHKLVEYISKRKRFVSENIVIVLGDAAGRHMKVTLPKVVFNVPSITRPESGLVPVTFEGTALQTDLDLADEIKVEYL